MSSRIIDSMIWLLIVAVGFFVLSVVSFQKIRSTPGKIRFTYAWAFLIGSFVWEDIMIFSLYFGVSFLVSFLMSSVKLAMLFFLLFWLIRSAGEALYFFLQQFIEPKHFPHHIDSHFTILRRIFGDLSEQQCFIIMQVLMQSICMLSAGAILVLLFGIPG